MTRRRATIILHWANVVLLSLLIAGGLQPAVGLAFAATGLAMTAIAFIRGLMSGPGPKLEGVMRSAHPILAWVMYAFLGITALNVALAIFGVMPEDAASRLVLGLFGVMWLHAIFHLWRHTALGDGALRRIMPRVFHDAL